MACFAPDWKPSERKSKTIPRCRAYPTATPCNASHSSGVHFGGTILLVATDQRIMCGIAAMAWRIRHSLEPRRGSRLKRHPRYSNLLCPRGLRVKVNPSRSTRCVPRSHPALNIRSTSLHRTSELSFKSNSSSLMLGAGSKRSIQTPSALFVSFHFKCEARPLCVDSLNKSRIGLSIGHYL